MFIFKNITRASIQLTFPLLVSGKSALAATVGIDSDFAYVKIVSFFLDFLHFSIKRYMSYFFLICFHYRYQQRQ